MDHQVHRVSQLRPSASTAIVFCSEHEIWTNKIEVMKRGEFAALGYLSPGAVWSNQPTCELRLCE